MTFTNDDMYKLFEILLNVREWTCREIVIISVISKEIRKLINNNKNKIHFVFVCNFLFPRSRAVKFQQILDSLKEINQLKNISYLNLSHNGSFLTNEVLKIITKYELDLQNIESIDISLNSLDSDFLNKLSFNFSNIVRLNIGGNKIGTKGANILASKFFLLTTLTDLCICDCKIGEYGAESIGQSIGQLRLTHLSISENNIGTRGANNIIKKIPNLVFLNLSGNAIDICSFEEFAYNLNCLTKLTELNLANNYIKKPSLLHKVFKNLLSLNLSNNSFSYFDNNDICNLGRVLSQNTKLLSLDLSCNNIIPYDAEFIILSLNCTKLASLDISYGSVEIIRKYCKNRFPALKENELNTYDNN
jgi:hypothetical protein